MVYFPIKLRETPLGYHRMPAAMTVQPDAADTAGQRRGPTMRRFTLFFLAFVWLWAPPAAGEQARAYTNGLLWRIESPSAPPSYVFGTIHVSDERVETIIQDMLEAVGPLDSISLEIVQTPANMTAAAQHMVSQNGPTLSQRVGPNLFAQTVAAAAPYGMTAEILEHFKPWAAAVTLSMPASQLRAQAAGDLTSERLLESYAAVRQIALYGIETIDEQLGLFDGLAEAEQIGMLQVSVRQNRVIDDIFARLVNAYLAQDLTEFHRVMEDFSVGETADLQEFFERKLIADRNHRMVERIQPRLAEGRALIAVGALHLPDKEGILRLLERRGYTIVRMPTLGFADPAR